MAAQQVQRFSPARVLADDDVEFAAIARRLRSHSAAIVHHMTRIAWQQHDVAGLQQQRLTASRIIQYRSPADDCMIRDFVRLARALIDAPGRR